MMHRTMTLAVVILVLLLVAGPSVSAADAMYKRGDRGPDVIAIQAKLKGLGYKITAVDGIFGGETEAAVKKYQHQNRLKATGVVEGQTYTALVGRPRVLPERGGTVTADKIIHTAFLYRGVPYKFGGTTPQGFDCSGFVWFVFNKNNLHLPRLADEQFRAGKPVLGRDLQRGDLVFFTTYEKGASHCGIYLGNGQFIHAASKKGVSISKLDDFYWQPRYFGACRVL